jgi:transcription elongation GreA/GreB family factor
MSYKEDIYKECIKLVDKRFNNIKNNIDDIQNSLLSETKSSAGDKHETGRAMLQLEREKAGVQLSEVNNLRKTLDKINIDNEPKQVNTGSLVYTSKVNYFIAVSLGLIEIKDKLCYAISPQTPIGQLLMGKTVGDTIEFKGSRFLINKLE